MCVFLCVCVGSCLYSYVGMHIETVRSRAYASQCGSHALCKKCLHLCSKLLCLCVSLYTSGSINAAAPGSVCDS